VVQESAWSKDPQAETLGGTKVAKVVRYDEVGLARHSDLNDHLPATKVTKQRRLVLGDEGILVVPRRTPVCPTYRVSAARCER
jgi:hypothetical protein